MVTLDLGPYRAPAHFLFEAAAYALGLRWYLRSRRPSRLSPFQTWTVLAGAALGAAIGSKLLALLYHPDWLQALTRGNFPALQGPAFFGGKTIVGGLLGGWAGVEWAKRRDGWSQSTGDDITLPLVAALALGRVGCFLGGLDDNTAGAATALPWGVDFGDGVARHPTQLYEIGFLGALAPALKSWRERPHREGDVFLLFLLSYLLFRVAADFLKPYPGWVLGLSAIQAAALAGAGLCAWRLWPRRPECA